MSLTLLAMLAFQAEKPTATVKLDAKTATVGQPLKGSITLTLPEGQHGYQNPPASEFDNPITLKVVDKGFKLGKVDYPKGVEIDMLGEKKKVYEGTITIPFTLVAGKPLPKVTSVSFSVGYQLCTMTTCYPPTSLTLKTPLKVVPAPKKAAKKP